MLNLASMISSSTLIKANKSYMIYDLASCISAAIDADAFNLYVHEVEGVIKHFVPKQEK